MISEDCLPAIELDESSTELRTLIQKESVVDVEVPVKGLLIKEKIVICDCSQDQLEAQTSNISHFCTGSLNHPLFIKTNKVNRPLMCRLNDLSVNSGKLFLNDFRFMDQIWIDRQFDRVQPGMPLFASVVKSRKKTKANLFDISQTGMCLLIDKSSFANHGKLLNSEMQILLKLPPKNEQCTIRGRVVQSQKISGDLLRVGLKISMAKKDTKIVAHYLSERKREILDELFRNFLDLLNYRETRDLYF